MGKTTLARAVERTHPRCTVFSFDSIGVPSADVMATFGDGHQPGGAWQRAMTLQWMERIAPIVESGQSVLFEGQMRIAFIQEALAAQKLGNAHILLVDCTDVARSFRLVHERGQPGLANESMKEWAKYLREEAIESGCEILDTSVVSFDDGVALIALYLSEGNAKP